MAETHGNRTHPPNRNRHGTTVLKSMKIQHATALDNS